MATKSKISARGCPEVAARQHQILIGPNGGIVGYRIDLRQQDVEVVNGILKPHEPAECNGTSDPYMLLGR